MPTQDILQNLSVLPGPAGFEEPVSAYLRLLLIPFFDDVRTDVMGNLIAVRKSGSPNAKKLLLDAHSDEIGLIVTGVEDGFLRFAPLGGLDSRTLPASEVTILTDPPLYGIIATIPPHLLKNEDTSKFTKIDDLFIDIGYTQDQAEKLVPPGTPAVLRSIPLIAGNNVIFAKAIDDRAGVASILRALQLLGDSPLNIDLCVLFSTQEEVGTRGAAPAAFSINPDFAVVIDANFAKSPDSKPHEINHSLGDGVIISIGPNMNKPFTNNIINLAANKNIKHKIDVEPGGNSGTNARVIQLTRDGVAAALIGMPVRNMHSPYEIASLDDVETTALLLSEIILNAQEVCL